MLGALYPDGTSGNLKRDDSVPPGGSYTYRWEVKPEFAPTDDDANCLTWVYHSHLDAPKDIASGLIGALLTCKKGNKIWLKSSDQTCSEQLSSLYLLYSKSRRHTFICIIIVSAANALFKPIILKK